jgi:hypothetical protein
MTVISPTSVNGLGKGAWAGIGITIALVVIS